MLLPSAFCASLIRSFLCIVDKAFRAERRSAPWAWTASSAGSHANAPAPELQTQSVFVGPALSFLLGVCLLLQQDGVRLVQIVLGFG